MEHPAPVAEPKPDPNQAVTVVCVTADMLPAGPPPPIATSLAADLIGGDPSRHNPKGTDPAVSPAKSAVSGKSFAGRGRSYSLGGNGADKRPPAPPGKFKQSPAHAEHEEINTVMLLNPKTTYDSIVAAGVGKTQVTLVRQVVLGLLAGFYISFGFTLAIFVGGQIPTVQKNYPGFFLFILGSIGLPMGLTMIMIAGADLFTGSCLYMTAALIEGRVTLFHLAKAWIISWFANLAGCLIMVRIMHTAELFHAEPARTFLFALAKKKTSYSFAATVCRGIIANWLVNMAVWMANSARDVTGKFVGVYLPVSTFTIIGGEHVIANQFLLSMAKQTGNGMSTRHIVRANLVPATIGNIVGGAFFVATFYAATYGTLNDRIGLAADRLYTRTVPKRMRTRLAAAKQAAADKLEEWVDWDALMQPAGPLGGGPTTPRGPASKKPSRGLSSSLAAAPARALSAALAATRRPALTPFERKRTSGALGGDAV